ncbi:hypothetical protein H6P81_005130 [Aristolochia fimbriata]|uniref:Uncharacterized protein n=1 Tax=Aristolochia fimbriata TaxID=158543 RepID=A0AAV7EUR7_ARIFI|nr:hypothetical protein H6P81_005130 [Aristolochia fimbriata]
MSQHLKFKMGISLWSSQLLAVKRLARFLRIGASSFPLNWKNAKRRPSERGAQTSSMQADDTVVRLNPLYWKSLGSFQLVEITVLEESEELSAWRLRGSFSG